MIVQCPECGGQISDKAQVCVHCGYRFRVCPGCGKILADNESMCPSCGHIFSADTAHETAAPSQQASVPSRAAAPATPYALWMHDDAKARILNKALVVGKWGLFSVGIMLIVAALIVYFSWVKTSELEKIFTAQKTQSTLAVLGTIGLILAGDITAFEKLQNVMRWEMGAIWLRRAKIPAEEMLVECGKINDQRKDIPDKEMAQFNDSVSMTYLAAHPQKTILLVVGLIIQFILWIAFAVFYKLFCFERTGSGISFSGYGHRVFRFHIVDPDNRSHCGGRFSCGFFKRAGSLV